MAYEITLDREARILRVRYTGEVSLDERLVIAGQVLGVMQTTGVHRVLLDFRGAQSLGAKPEAVARIVNQCMPHLPADARLAYLVQYDHQVDSSVEDLARSCGYQVDRFHDKEVALAWLQEGSDSVPPDMEPAEQGTPRTPCGSSASSSIQRCHPTRCRPWATWCMPLSPRGWTTRPYAAWPAGSRP